MGVAHFKDLHCWRLSHELKMSVYAMTSKPPLLRDRNVCDDIRRSARSAPANISEGFGRYTHRDFAHFLAIAHASLMETENHLHHAKDEKGLSEGDWTRLVDLATRAQRATAGLRRYLLGGQ